MDKFTYGDTIAAQVLVDLLQKDGNICSRQVSRCYHEYMAGIREVCKIKDIHIRRAMLDAWYLKARQKAENLNIPELIKNYLLNVVNSVSKKLLREWRKNG